MTARESRRGRGFGFAGFLIIAGAVLLLSTLDLLPTGYHSALARLWPAILVAIGANMVLSRIDRRIGSVASLLIIVAALAAAWPLALWSEPVSPGMVSPFRIERTAAPAAAVRLTVGGGELTVGPGTDSTAVVEGTLEACRENAVKSSVRETAGVLRVSLSSRGDGHTWSACFGRGGFVGENWDVKISPQIPVDLEIEAGASNTHLDLTELLIPKLHVEAGASSAAVVMPARGRTEASIETGATNLEIAVPSQIAARIRVEVGAGSLSVDEGRFPRVSGSNALGGLAIRAEYKSVDFDTASDRVDVTIKGGASSIRIR